LLNRLKKELETNRKHRQIEEARKIDEEHYARYLVPNPTASQTLSASELDVFLSEMLILIRNPLSRTSSSLRESAEEDCFNELVEEI